jgi:hypothetical protein
MSSFSIYHFLTSCSPEDLASLYSSPWCALAVLQSLSPLSRAIIFRLQAARQPVLESFLRMWLRSEEPSQAHPVRCSCGYSTDSPDGRCSACRALAGALGELRALQLLGEPGEEVAALGIDGFVQASRGVWSLNGSFVKALHEALTSGEEEPWEAASRALPPPARGHPPVAAIEAASAARWDAILHYLLGTAGALEPDPNVTVLLVSTGLLKPGLQAVGLGASSEGLGLPMSGDAMEPEARAPRGRRRRGEGGGSGGGGGGGDPPARLTYDQIVEEGGGDTHITRAGYEFLLKDTSLQLWTFVHEYIRTAPLRGLKVTDILAMLFQLGFCVVGRGYALHALTETQRLLLNDFTAFGLVHLPPRGSDAERRFYPASLAIALTQQGGGGGAPAPAGAGAGAPPAAPAAPPPPPPPPGLSPPGALPSLGGGRCAPLRLLVETNFRVFARSSDTLHVALLALFCRVEMRLPNLIVASLTRRSVVSAHSRGITSARIVAFLTENGEAPLPENVHQQLLLWEMEKDRVLASRAALLGPFPGAHVAAAVAARAEAEGHLQWRGEVAGKAMLVVAEAGLPPLRAWARRELAVTLGARGAAQEEEKEEEEEKGGGGGGGEGGGGKEEGEDFV